MRATTRTSLDRGLSPVRSFTLSAVLMSAIALAVFAMPRVLVAQGAGVDTMSRPASSTAPIPGVDRELDERVKQVAKRLRCPVCQGESIQDSPAELAAQMKLLVREQLYEGKSETEVLDYFMARYGQWIMLEPRAEGFNLLVYWLPVLFLVFGGAGIWMAVRRWTAKPVNGDAGA